jgi:hypothetical protein
MFELFKRNENPATAARKLEEQKQSLRTHIQDIEARIVNGTHVPDDTKILERLKAELAALE